jgi:site-specific DNA recombinase
MAEQRGHDRSVKFEHAFDRLLAVKLEQVYEILVPEQIRIIGTNPRVRGKSAEGRCDLRQSILRAAEGGEHNCEPDSGVARVRAGTGIRGTR